MINIGGLIMTVIFLVMYALYIFTADPRNRSKILVYEKELRFWYNVLKEKYEDEEKNDK